MTADKHNNTGRIEQSLLKTWQSARGRSRNLPVWSAFDPLHHRQALASLMLLEPVHEGYRVRLAAEVFHRITEVRLTGKVLATGPGPLEGVWRLLDAATEERKPQRATLQVRDLTKSQGWLFTVFPWADKARDSVVLLCCLERTGSRNHDLKHFPQGGG